MAIAAILAGGLIIQVMIMSCMIVGSRADDREEEDREQAEYLRQWNEKRRKR